MPRSVVAIGRSPARGQARTVSDRILSRVEIEKLTAMANRWRHLARAMRLFRPRTLAQLERSDQKLLQQVEQLSAGVRSLERELSDVRLRERQLRAILHADMAETGEPELDAILHDPGTASH